MTEVRDALQHAEMPEWLPAPVRRYLAHTEGGDSIRALARADGIHASTVLRQVRRLEGRRDDPLVEQALQDLTRHGRDGGRGADVTAVTSERMSGEGRRILDLMEDRGAVLAVAQDMDMAVVIRDRGDGTPERLTSVARPLVQAMALSDWIASTTPGARISRYHLTQTGRAELRGTDALAHGMAEAAARFDAAGPTQDAHLTHMRSVLPESPLASLARRRDPGGQPFLARGLVAAGERLREDFELSQMGPRIAQDWERFLTGAGRETRASGRDDSASEAARVRLVEALQDLGPGLGDVALRCCCYLEGMETLERRLGWSARSGKIVLRIALQRLRLHYDRTQGRLAPKIG